MSAPAEEEKKPTVEEVLAKLAADSYENKKAINTMAEAIVKLNEKIEGLKAGGGGKGGDLFDFLKSLTEKKGTEIDAVVKGAENLAKLAEALDRYRNPPRLGVGEAFLMRLGMRAGYPRYMTKAELQRIERAAGVYEVLEGKAEGESEGGEHVKE